MWNRLLRPLRHWYFRNSYGPEPIERRTGSISARHRIDSARWISTPIPACITTCMQMIADYYHIDCSRRHFDFLMGFTYGAGDLPGIGYMPVGNDPETGYLEAAPYIGLKSQYFTTNDPDLYLEAIRCNLTEARPVRLPVDMGALYGSDEVIPHSEVIIGYDEDVFEYYEPVCQPPAVCPHEDHNKGDQGCYVAEERLLDAVYSLSKIFDYPWRYGLSIFEAGPLSTDVYALWPRNGRNLVGGQRMGMRWGAAATEHLANQIEKQNRKLDYERLRLIFEIGAYMRSENAAFLRNIAGDRASILKAAELFDKSAACFWNAFEALSSGLVTPNESQAIVEYTREIAGVEREAGKIFLAIEKNINIPTIIETDLAA